MGMVQKPIKASFFSENPLKPARDARVNINFFRANPCRCTIKGILDLNRIFENEIKIN